MTGTLPDTHDALKLLTYSLELPMLERGTGDTLELFSINAPRSLRVWWDDGWTFETMWRHEVDDTGSIHSVDELRDQLVWVEGERTALAILGRDPLASDQDLDTLTHAEVLAPYVERPGVDANVSHGALFFKAGGRELDVSRDGVGWWALRSWDLSDEEPVRIHTRADLDAHVAWVAGEAG